MSATLSFRADDRIKSLLEAFARKKHISKTEVINQALSEFLSKTDEKITKQVSILRATDSNDDYLGDL